MSTIVVEALEISFMNEQGRKPTETELEELYSEYCKGIEEFFGK